jgi:hypothetical protein
MIIYLLIIFLNVFLYFVLKIFLGIWQNGEKIVSQYVWFDGGFVIIHFVCVRVFGISLQILLFWRLL